MITIEHHAVLYALFVKYMHQYFDEEMALFLIEKATFAYGYRRGERMRQNTLADGCPLDMNSFFLFGEWKGRDGENISRLDAESNVTQSTVLKCGWYDAWQKHDLVQYGRFYCRYIDQGICAGYNGPFSLDIPETIGGGDDKCIFRWSMSYDTEKLAKARVVFQEKTIKPFSFHCEEMIDTFQSVLEEFPKEKSEVFQSVEDEFLRMFPDQNIFQRKP